jgi:hypothetical protein
VVGVAITLWMRATHPESLARATAAFGGESDELAHDGPVESMSLGH